MNRTILLGFCGVVLVLGAWRDARAQTATVELSPASSTIGVGDWVQVFVSGTGFDDGTDGGDFSLAWAPNLAFVGLTVEGSPWDVSAADTTNAVNGSIDSVDVFASTGTPGSGGAQFPIARLTLRATAEGTAFVGLGPDLVGWSLDGGSLTSAFGPNAEIEVSGVPEPRIAGALALGIYLLGSLGRGRRGAIISRNDPQQLRSSGVRPIEKAGQDVELNPNFHAPADEASSRNGSYGW